MPLSRYRWAFLAIFTLIILAAATAALIFVPDLLNPSLDLDSLQPFRLTDKEKFDLINANKQLQSSSRTAIVQLLVGLGALSAAILAWRQFQHTRREALRAEHEKLEEFQLDLFNAALKNLGDDRADIRIGGMFALYRLIEVSEAQRTAGAEVLSAFIRSKSPWPPSAARPARGEELYAHTGRSLRDFDPDVQAALSLLGEHNFLWYRLTYLRFRHTDLRKANLATGGYEGTAFTEARMDGAWMVAGNFEGCSFRDTKLVNASLEGANLRHCNLRGADFTNSRLRGVDLEGACFDDTTKWPADLDLAELKYAISIPVDSPASSPSRNNIEVR